jgi:hypothetical protein
MPSTATITKWAINSTCNLTSNLGFFGKFGIVWENLGKFGNFEIYWKFLDFLEKFGFFGFFGKYFSLKISRKNCFFSKNCREIRLLRLIF